jgi:hypothetical protein
MTSHYQDWVLCWAAVTQEFQIWDSGSDKKTIEVLVCTLCFETTGSRNHPKGVVSDKYNCGWPSPGLLVKFKPSRGQPHPSPPHFLLCATSPSINARKPNSKPLRTTGTPRVWGLEATWDSRVGTHEGFLLGRLPCESWGMGRGRNIGCYWWKT